MSRHELLDLIWQNKVRLATDSTAQSLLDAFSRFVPVKAICLRVECARACADLLPDDFELVPDLPLGDVLAQEFDADVPYGSLVILLPDTTAEPDTSFNLGRIVAEAAHIATSSGTIPIQKQTDALYLAIHSAMTLASSPDVYRAGIDRRRFALGMASALAPLWAPGSRRQADMLPLFNRADFLASPDLLAHLRKIDAGFSAPDPMTPPPDMLPADGKVSILRSWIGRIEDVLRDVLSMPAAREQNPTLFPRALH